MRKNDYRKMALMGMLLIILLAIQTITGREKAPFPEVTFITEPSVPLNLTDFDPNELDAKQWEHLGFSEKQAATILHYKNIVGGQFTSKAQFKKCYAVSPEKFAQLESYLLLPETGRNDSFRKFKSYEKKALTVSGKFNPDGLSVAGWIAMGFSEKQAEAIVKYRNYLGGSFVSKEKFKECFIISSDNYSKLESHLLLPSKTPADFKNSAKSYAVKSNIQYRSFDPNMTDSEGWKALGFSERQAQTIVNYRDRNLRGSFKTLEDLQKCFVISPEKFQEIKPYIQLHPTVDKKQETDFSKIDLNTITFKQLLEFGLDEKSAGSMIGFRKKLRGFVNKQQIMDTYNIDKDLVQKLISIAPLDVSNVPKYTLTEAPEEWLKDHPYFKYSADKIIFYRTTYRDDVKILKLLKLKPQYEERMKWYLK